MEIRITTRSLKRQLNHVILYEQVENGVAINNNLSAYHVDHQFVTPRRVSQLEQKHPWIEKRLTSHKMPQATLIILREMQVGEAQRRTNNL
jgi:hypothetical protein